MVWLPKLLVVLIEDELPDDWVVFWLLEGDVFEELVDEVWELAEEVLVVPVEDLFDALDDADFPEVDLPLEDGVTLDELALSVLE